MSTRLLRRCQSVVLPLLACALIAPAALAATPGQAAPAAAATQAPPRPLLWKVSDKDNSLYLLGSFHLLKKSDYPLSGDVEAAFADAEKLVFEVPPAQLTDPETARKMQLVAGYGDERTLTKVLPADVREKLDAMLGAQGVAQLDAYEPWFVNLSLLLGVSQVLGFEADQGLDQHLMRRAAEARKPTSGLETIDRQLEVLDATPMSEQIGGLRDFLANPAAVPKMLDDMHGAWRNGEADRLNTLAVEEMRKRTPVTYRLINVERNDAWVPQLSQLLDGSSGDDAMAVVGAMHLLGEDGVVAKLRAKGYRVERVCSGCGVE